MINVSNKFKQALLDDKRQFEIEATITLIDDTELTITNSELWSQGFEIDTSVSGNNSFDIGGLIIGRMTLVINNIYEDYTQYDFFDADVDVTLTLPFDDGTSESIVFDNFIVDEATDNESQIVLTCLDNAKHFERPYSESNLAYPASVNEIVLDACDTCGVPLLTTSIQNGNYVVSTRPSNDGLTFLKVVSWCAQLTGNFARINNHGQLVVGWYDIDTLSNTTVTSNTITDTEYSPILDTDDDSISDTDAVTDETANGHDWTIPEPDASEYHHIVSWSSLTVGTDDVLITGVRVVATSSDNTEFVGFYGSEGYVLEVRGNDLIGVSDVQSVAASIGLNVIGLRFRAYSGACLGDPTIEASDLIWITDRKNRSYRSLICGTCFKLGQYQNLYCGAATPSRHSAVSYSESTRAIVKTRQEIKKSLADYDSRVSSMAELIARGFGMYFTPVTQQDGSVIPYIHDKPTVAESSYIAYMTSQGIMMESDGTTTAAVDRNGNALLNTLTARGINADWINSGAISIRDTQGNETFYANCLTGVVRINATSFSLTGSTVQQIAQEAVDNIKVGGRNLGLNSKTFSASPSKDNRYFSWRSGTTQIRTDGFTEQVSTQNWWGIRIYANSLGLKVSDTVTFSCNVRNDSSIQNRVYFYCMAFDSSGTRDATSKFLHIKAENVNIDGQNCIITDIEPNSEKRIWVTLTWLQLAEDLVNSNGSIEFSLQSWSTDWTMGSMSYYAPKIEKGNVMTDWSPAPEDLDIDSLGGRNILLDGNFTNGFDKWSFNYSSGATRPEIVTEDGIKCCHYIGEIGKVSQVRQNILDRIANDEVGQQYTVSFDIKLVNYTSGTTNPFLQVYFSGTYDDNGTQKYMGATWGKESPNLAPYNNKGWIHVTVSNLYFVHKPINEMWFMIYSRDWSGDLYFTNFKLERGNKATDWTPAPEDVQADIDTATATANAANTTAQQANATAQQALDVASSAGGLVAYLDNDYQSIPTDANGNYVTFPECSSKITVFYNSNDVSAQCTYATAVTTGVTGSWNNSTRTYTVTGLTADSGTVTITAAYNNTSLSKKFTVIKVRQGISGTNGQNGRSISSMEEYYAISASNSTAPTSWSVNVVAPTESLPYLWNFDRIVYDDNTQEDSQPRVIGNYAQNGQPGQNGRGITSITEHYGLSNSTTTEPTSWSDTMQVPTSSAKYLWNYETITYTDSTTENTTKRIIGNYSANGAGAYNYELILSDVAIVKDAEGNITPSTITMTAKRNQGTGSPSNYSGRFKVEVTTNGTSYTTAYTSSANEATHTYTLTGNEKNIRISLYLAGGTTTLLDSQSVPVISDGVDGVSPTITSTKSGGVTTVTITDTNGSRTLTINDGTAGASIATVTNYYLASASATGVTTSTSGWTTNPTASGATISASKPYLWNYEVSKDNNNVTIATTSPAIIGHFGTNGKGISSIEEYYALHSGTSAPSDSRFSTDVQTPTSELRYLWNYEKTTYTDGTYTTTAKHIIGVYGDPGLAGADAYTVILSNESHTFAGTGGHAIASSVDCNIIAYKGATRVAASIGTITGTITNKLSVTKTNDGTTTAKITVSATNTLDTQSGVLTIPITVDGKSFTKTFSWSVAYNGTNGSATRSYFLDVTPKSIKIGENLAYTPNSITVNSYYRDGDSATNTSYTGYMYIESCKNNTWSSIQNCNFTASTFTITLAYTANENPSYDINTAVLSLPATLSAIRIRLKPSLNSTTILDQQDVIILVDISSLTQETILNKLTNNQQLEGIFMEDGKLYIHSSYVRSGILKLGGSNNVNGLLKVLNSNGAETVVLDNTGINAIYGNIAGWKIDDHSLKKEVTDNSKINTMLQCPSGTTSTVLAIGAEYKNGATDWTTAPFRVTALGKMYATGAEISGKITATSGKIGGWDITTNSLRNETEGTSNNILIGSTTNNVLSIGATWTSGADATDWSTGKFRVLKNGSMYATAGEIGGWKITTNSIRREEKDGADALLLCPTGATSTVLSIGAPTVSNSIKWAQAPFYVKGNGKLFTSGASINGTFESKTGNQSVKIVNGIIYGYYGSTKAGLIDMSAYYSDSERIISVRGEKRLHLQGGSEIWFEIGGAAMHFTSRSLSVSTKIEGELHDDRGFSGVGYLPTGFYQDGTVTGWVEVVIKDGIVR